GSDIDVVVNIQGDEPFIQPTQIDQVIACFEDETVEIATLIRKVGPGEDIVDKNEVKTIIDSSGNAIYFSRAAIPFVRDAAPREWTFMYPYYTHLGVYAFKTGTLGKITSLQQSMLEKAESLEQNRWLENGFRIRTALTQYKSICIETPEDLKKANLFFNEMK
ncbi:MAG: 3-deoxy-manno-octulosonate cytidylyltransferase, partial [Bacteroidales bacterium]